MKVGGDSCIELFEATPSSLNSLFIFGSIIGDSFFKELLIGMLLKICEEIVLKGRLR